MHLYESLGPNPRATRMFLLEKGITIPTKTVDLLGAENRKPPYTDRNPGGQLPALELDNPEQIVALPLGSRVKVDPWAGQLKFVKARPPRIYSAKDKLALEVTPFSPYLVRLKPVAANGVPEDSTQGR